MVLEVPGFEVQADATLAEISYGGLEYDVPANRVQMTLPVESDEVFSISSEEGDVAVGISLPEEVDLVDGELLQDGSILMGGGHKLEQQRTQRVA